MVDVLMSPAGIPVGWRADLPPTPTPTSLDDKQLVYNVSRLQNTYEGLWLLCDFNDVANCHSLSGLRRVTRSTSDKVPDGNSITLSKYKEQNRTIRGTMACHWVGTL